MALDVYKKWLGIPEEFRPPTHYQLLRVVDFQDDTTKIEAHYRKLNGHVRKYATGQYSLESQELLNELAKAMLCLTDPVRKREYDESLGREFEDDDSVVKTTGQVLVQEEHISKDQMKEVEQFADRRGLSFRDAIVQMKLVDQTVATRAMAAESRLGFVDLGELPPDETILDQVPRNLVKRHAFIPLFIDGDVLLVACPEQPDLELEEELRLRFGVPVRPVLATPLSINKAIALYYAPGMREEAVTPQTPKKSQKKSSTRSKKSNREKTTQADAPVVLSKEEQKQKTQMGYLIIIGSGILTSVFSNLVLHPFFLSNRWNPWTLMAGLLAIVMPTTTIFVYFKFLKK